MIEFVGRSVTLQLDASEQEAPPRPAAALCNRSMCYKSTGAEREKEKKERNSILFILEKEKNEK